ncbi:hypothetical protein SNEBB_009932, partial [Seison nebaliae]
SLILLIYYVIFPFLNGNGKYGKSTTPKNNSINYGESNDLQSIDSSPYHYDSHIPSSHRQSIGRDNSIEPELNSNEINYSRLSKRNSIRTPPRIPAESSRTGSCRYYLSGSLRAKRLDNSYPTEINLMTLPESAIRNED